MSLNSPDDQFLDEMSEPDISNGGPLQASNVIIILAVHVRLMPIGRNQEQPWGSPNWYHLHISKVFTHFTGRHYENTGLGAPALFAVAIVSDDFLSSVSKEAELADKL